MDEKNQNPAAVHEATAMPKATMGEKRLMTTSMGTL
jgi:hypothetical protein